MKFAYFSRFFKLASVITLHGTIKLVAKNAINTPATGILAIILMTSMHIPAAAQSSTAVVAVKDAWVRASVPGQTATGAFMTITAKMDLKLVSVSSPAAGVSEVHEMKMDGDIMRMRAVQGGLDLPAGKAVDLKPGGFHVMLMDLKAALPKDSKVPVTLVFKDAKGLESKVELTVPVAILAPSAKPGMGAAMPANQPMNQHKH